MSPLRLILPRFATLGAAAALAFTTACGDTGDEAAEDTAAIAATTPADTGMMGGMDHSKMAGMNRTAPHDSNQVFLRMMSDHHEGLIMMSDSARLQGATAKADAAKLKEKQQREQQEMMSMLRATHNDSITPMMMPSNRAMMDSTMRAAGAAADSAYYHHVINHHREGIRMTEAILPHLTGEVKAMAEKMMADQRKEITEFERKMRG
ncbi:MAG TPA: DUF305 domain-containing protein [Gemmatimonadaceae bacterium]|nr:DUF305 domain-containing protein [Gemmatimonadaceae bacterium]